MSQAKMVNEPVNASSDNSTDRHSQYPEKWINQVDAFPVSSQLLYVRINSYNKCEIDNENRDAH